MQVNKFKIGLLSAAAVLALGVFSSCSKDFQGDIDGINNRISKIDERVMKVEKAVETINGQIAAGATIKIVENLDNGIKVTLSNGQSYTIVNGKDGKDGQNGKDGQDGQNGTPGTVLKIGEDGYWYIDGVKSEYPAKGVKGEPGAPGAQGPKGEKGDTYEPNADGFWYLNGKKTDKKWLAEGTLTAVFKDGVLTIFGAENAPKEGIKLGEVRLNSLVVLPQSVKEGFKAVPFYSLSLPSYCGKEIALGAELKVKLNPSNVPLAEFKKVTVLVQRPEVLRAQDSETEIEVPWSSIRIDNKGYMTVPLTSELLKTFAKELEGKLDMISVNVETEHRGNIGSDWIRLVRQSSSSDQIKVALRGDKEGKTFIDLPRSANKGTKEGTVAYWLNSGNQAVQVAYNKPLDLADLVATLDGAKEFKNVYGLTYKFELPTNVSGEPVPVLAEDGRTNQQEFIQIADAEKGTVVPVVLGKPGNKASIGRRPIVQVMLMTGDCPLYSAIIPLEIVDEVVKPIDPEIVPNEVLINEPFDVACDGFEEDLFKWKRFNEDFYADANMSKVNFHKTYKLEAVKGVGTLAENEYTGKPNETYSVIWTVTKDEALKALQGKDEAVISITASYVGGPKTYTFTAKRTIKRPVIADHKKLHINNMWNKEGENTVILKHALPGGDVASLDSYKLSFDSFFKMNADGSFDYKANKKDANVYKPSFSFAAEQTWKPTDPSLKGYFLKGEGNDLNLYKPVKNAKPAKVGTVAHIDATSAVPTIELVDIAAGKDLDKDHQNNAAQIVLNDAESFTVQIAMKVENGCGIEYRVKGHDSGIFDAQFLRPINPSENKTVNYEFWNDRDPKTEHTYVAVRQLAKVVDRRDFEFTKNNNYDTFYGLKNILVDTKATTLKGYREGNVPVTEIAKSKVVIETVSSIPGVTPAAKYGYVLYTPIRTGIQQDFNLEMPVTVKYAFGNISVGKVIVKVLEKHGNQPAGSK